MGNQLSSESSPYLVQHADNPIHWLPWGEAAFLKAQTENKLIILSIGYSSCHWCHVMAHETFENEEVASYSNEHYVSIKVDREEHPDVDALYMKAVQMITNQGGWPLNCILLPNKKPFFGGTYFKKERWLDVLQQIQKIHKEEPSKLVEYADDLHQGLEEIYLFPKKITTNAQPEVMESAFLNGAKNFDHSYGGTLGSPKFPLPNKWLWYLNFGVHYQNQKSLDHVFFTLDCLCRSGLNDQIEGGFYRYAVDSFWKIPHFEKMLYDNAQMLSLLAQSHQVRPSELVKHTALQLIDWVYSNLINEEGGLQSALDADSEGAEGAYYIWKNADFDSLTQQQQNTFNQIFYSGDEAMWEHGQHVFYLKPNINLLALEDIRGLVKSWRSRRSKPGLDHKCLSSWNALMASALCDAFFAFRNQAHLKQALNLGTWILANQKNGQGLFHVRTNQKSHIDGLLEDYAFTIKAFINLYCSSADLNWLMEAKKLLEYALIHFYDQSSGLFFESTQNLIVKTIEVEDGVIPSSNAIMAENLRKLGYYFQNKEWSQWAHEMVMRFEEELMRTVSAYSQWGINWIHDKHPFEISIIEQNEEIHNFILDVVNLNCCIDYGGLPCSEKKEKGVFICGQGQCYPAIHDIIELKAHFDSLKGLP